MTWIPDPDAPAELRVAHRDGIPWWKATRHFRWQRHRAQTRGLLRAGRYVERCSCGAFGPEPWTRIDPWPKRRRRSRR